MKLRASVLPTVIVLGVLILTMVWMLIALMDLDLILFAHRNRLRIERANVESSFRLHCNYPQVDGEIELFGGDTLSRITVTKQDWGLYDLVSVRSCTGRVASSRLVGASRAIKDGSIFWYRNNLATLNVGGNTNLKGRLSMPVNGVIYASAGALNFCGEAIQTSDVYCSESEMPPPATIYTNRIDSLFEIHKHTIFNNSMTRKMENRFTNAEGWVVNTKSNILTDHTLRGRVVLLVDQITLDRSCTISNVIIVARKATIGKGFKGSLQLFARDTIIVDSAARLLYPSGVYARKYIRLDHKASVDGYIIVHSNPSIIDGLNYRQARSARVRGLLYVDGLAQLQGVVSGAAVLGRARYYASEGYYNDMIYDATIIGDESVAYPLWLDHYGKRKEASRVE